MDSAGAMSSVLIVPSRWPCGSAEATIARATPAFIVSVGISARSATGPHRKWRRLVPKSPWSRMRAPRVFPRRARNPARSSSVLRR